jgi:hypothetical protein
MSTASTTTTTRTVNKQVLTTTSHEIANGVNWSIVVQRSVDQRMRTRRLLLLLLPPLSLPSTTATAPPSVAWVPVARRCAALEQKPTAPAWCQSILPPGQTIADGCCCWSESVTASSLVCVRPAVTGAGGCSAAVCLLWHFRPIINRIAYVSCCFPRATLPKWRQNYWFKKVDSKITFNHWIVIVMIDL